jgi:hypothetical protein
MDSIDYSLGKYPDAFGNVVVMENELVNNLLKESAKGFGHLLLDYFSINILIKL